MKTCLIALALCLALTGCLGSGGTKSTAGSKTSESMSEKEVELHLRVAEGHIANRQPHLALRELQLTESAGNHLAQFHFDLGMTYLNLEELEKARDGFARATELDPEYGEAWNNLGKIEEALSRDAEAEKAYKQALSILTYTTPEFPAYNLSALLYREGRFEESEEFARKAITRNWRYIPAYILRSKALAAQNLMDDAEACLREGLAADVGSTTIMLALAEHYMRMGNTVDARKLLEGVVSQRPKSNDAKTARDYLDLLE